MDPYAPTPADRFTFGLWTVGNVGRDPFGEPCAPPLDPTHIVAKLAEFGAYGVNLHDNDLVPFGASAAERDRIVAALQARPRRPRPGGADGDHQPLLPPGVQGRRLHRATTRGCAPRARARPWTRSTSASSSARASTCSGAAARAPRPTPAAIRCDALRRYARRASTSCATTSADQGYDLRFALEAKPNEPRGDIFLPTAGHMLHFIATLEHPEMVGVNPEVAHETMAGLSFPHAVAQAMEAGKLFHVDLNDQNIGPLRPGPALRLRGPQDGVLHWSACSRAPRGLTHGARATSTPTRYRTEDEDGVWDFARGCMRTYKMLAEKARRFDADPEIAEALAAYRADDPDGAWPPRYTAEHAAALKARAFELEPLRRRGPGLERLDQLTVELLLGVR